jgi:hypothetical protein
MIIYDICYQYEKKRKDFGRPLGNMREETRQVGSIPHEEARKPLYTYKNPKTQTLGNIPEYTEHGVSIG